MSNWVQSLGLPINKPQKILSTRKPKWLESIFTLMWTYISIQISVLPRLLVLQVASIFFPPAGTNGVNPKEMVRYISIENLLCSFLITEEPFNYFSLSTFLNHT